MRVPKEVVAEVAKRIVRSALLQVRRAVLARAASKLPADLLDDARLAATEELAHRGIHVITHRPRPRVVQRSSHGEQETR